MLQNSGFCYLVFEGGEIEERDFLTNQTSSGEADKSAFDQIIGKPSTLFKKFSLFFALLLQKSFGLNSCHCACSGCYNALSIGWVGNIACCIDTFNAGSG